MGGRKNGRQVTRYAEMFAAMGAEPRLRIVRLLLTAHPQGLVVGDIQEALGVPASTLSHHLDKLKNKDLVRVRREGTYIWYTVNTAALGEIMNFLYAECCTRNQAVEPKRLVSIGRPQARPTKGKANECEKHQGSGAREVRAGSPASDKRRRLVLWRGIRSGNLR